MISGGVNGRGESGFPDMEGKRGMSAESLIRLLGNEAAERLMYYWGGTRVSVPDIADLNKLKLRERIHQAYQNGATPSQIAERFGISVRTAQRIRSLPNCIERKSEMI